MPVQLPAIPSKDKQLDSKDMGSSLYLSTYL